MSFLKHLREYAPVNARSANFIPFANGNDSIENGRWVEPPCGDDEPKTDKKQELLDIVDRLRELIADDGNSDDSLDDMEDEELDGEFIDDDVAASMDDFSEDPEQEEDDTTGVRRYVKNAHLVYKKRMPDGLFEELWIFNVGKETPNDEYQIRREILGATDIEPPETTSKDGTQSYSTWSAGNAQLLHITGLPN